MATLERAFELAASIKASAFIWEKEGVSGKDGERVENEERGVSVSSV